jgi:trehalose 6-phosphate phosphatase
MMRYILSRSNREILEQFAWSNVLLAFDFDGTLAPIVSEPDRAAMRPMTRQLLEIVARLYPCIVISGRAQADALKRLQGIEVKEVIGNHGLETLPAAQRATKIARRWRAVLEEKLGSYHGILIEDKAYSVAIHYRRSREKKRARAAILKAAGDLEGVRLIGGKHVINVLPRGAPHKGIALENERLRHRCDTALYVGDDETDEDVFMLDQPGQLLTIRIGQRRASAASYYVRNQGEIDKLLRVLVSLRQNEVQRRKFE